MKKLAAILALLVAASGCAPKYGENWRPVSEGGFKIMFPGEPARNADGGQATYTLNQGDELFFASHMNGGLLIVMGNMMVSDPEEFMDQLRNGFVKQFNGTLLSERAVSAGELKGREVTVAAADGRELVARLYVSKTILYTALVARPKGSPLSEDAQKFLDSVEFESKSK